MIFVGVASEGQVVVNQIFGTRLRIINDAYTT